MTKQIFLSQSKEIELMDGMNEILVHIESYIAESIYSLVYQKEVSEKDIKLSSKLKALPITHKLPEPLLCTVRDKIKNGLLLRTPHGKLVDYEQINKMLCKALVILKGSSESIQCNLMQPWVLSLLQADLIRLTSDFSFIHWFAINLRNEEDLEEFYLNFKLTISSL